MKNFYIQLSHYLGESGLSFSQFLGKLLIAFSLFLAPLYGFFSVVILFVFADTGAGIYTSMKLGSGITEYQSHKFFNLPIKLIVYLGSIVLAYVVDRFIFDGKLFNVEMLLSKALTLLWVHNEVKSMDEKSVKLGNRPLAIIVKDLFTKAKNFKKDLNELQN